MDKIRVDAAIIGAGILGGQLADLLKTRHPSWEIALFDGEGQVGEHSSGRNSGVLHSSLYYPYQSNKHLLCLEGQELWYEMGPALNIPTKKLGKYVLSSSPDQDLALEQLYEQATRNQVKNLRWIDQHEKQKLSKEIQISSSFYCPQTGIVDVSEALTRFRDIAESKGVFLQLGKKIISLERSGELFSIEFEDYILETNQLFNCAGLGSVTLRKKLGLNDFEDYWIKGHYLYTNQTLSIPSLIYPVPPKDLKGLGVHSTYDFQGRLKFGPDTHITKELNYRMEPGFEKQMKPEIAKIFKTIDLDKLSPDYCGIRSKIKKIEKEQFESDFWIAGPKEHQIPGYFEACGIDSPGVTASPAIARRLCSFI